MKTIVKSFFFLSILTIFSAISCTYTVDSNTSTEQTGPEYTSAYVCPMNCEGSGSTEAGSCPVCKMDYVKNETN